MNMSLFTKRVNAGSSRGFTLIELLVVIAIIGILSSIVLASLNSARQKGRDARRVSDLKQLQLALELYYDANPSAGYPAQQAAGAPPKDTIFRASLLDVITPNYISNLPDDPGTGLYGYAGGGTTYTLGAILEQAGQTAALSNDNDTAQVITINGGATDCDDLAGLDTEVVYCVFP